MKSHSLHHEDTSRPCSRRASYTPSHAQLTAGCRAPGRGTHLPPVPFRAGSWAHTGRRRPHATGAQGRSPAPGRPRSLAALPAAHSRLPPPPLAVCAQTCPHASLGMGRRHGRRYGQASRGKSFTTHSQSNPVSRLPFYSFHPHFVLGSRKGRREEACLDGNPSVQPVFTHCAPEPAWHDAELRKKQSVCQPLGSWI